MMRVVFMGTPDFAAVILNELAQAHEVVGVWTRPDAVRGRGTAYISSPVKELAVRLGIPVFTPRSLSDSDEVAALRSLAPDVICVAAYGAILPREVLEIPQFGCLNVHASLLPRWRGAAPIERAILAGDEQVGVCIMRMEESLDAGSFCVSRAIPVEGRGLSDLTDELANLGALALITALAAIEARKAHWTSQDDASATYADKIAKGELFLDPALDALHNVRCVRASSNTHPARCVIAGRPVTVTAAAYVDDDDDVLDQIGNGQLPQIDERSHPNGEYEAIAVFVRKRLILGCVRGFFEVLSLKPDGKRDMDAASFAAGTSALRDPRGAIWGHVRE